MTMRTTRHETLTSRGSPAQAGHVRFGRRFVEEDESTGGKLALTGLPLATFFDHIRPTLLGRVERLFLYVSPKAMSA
jgi:hypothetical protein